MTTDTSAVAYLGKLLVYGLQKLLNKNPDESIRFRDEKKHYGSNGNHTLSVYDPATKKWFVVFTEEHRVSRYGHWNAILYVYEDKCYRILFEEAEDQKEEYTTYLKARVNELVFDLEAKTPSCHLGKSQDQCGITDVENCNSGGKFCINREVFAIINGIVVKIGHTVSTTEDADADVLRSWNTMYYSLRHMGYDMAITHYAFDVNRFEGGKYLNPSGILEEEIQEETQENGDDDY